MSAYDDLWEQAQMVPALKAQLAEARAQIAALENSTGDRRPSNVELPKGAGDRMPPVGTEEQFTLAIQHRDALRDDLAEARAQIAEQGFIIQQTQIDRDTWRSNYHEAAAQIAELKARIEAKEATLMRIDAALFAPARETE